MRRSPGLGARTRGYRRTIMDGFLLATPDGVLRTSGTRAAFDSAAAASTALRSGAAELIVGALDRKSVV